MKGDLTINEIGQEISSAATDLNHYCSSLTDEQFFYQPADKWSPAQQVRHLIIAADNTRLAFALPKFIVRWYAGRPNRPSRNYDELVAKYKFKLEQGGTEKSGDSTSTLCSNAEWEDLWRIFLPPMGCFMRAFRPWGQSTRRAWWWGFGGRGTGSRW